jgi:CubicO group peptidase (beta-lactamase class C family)
MTLSRVRIASVVAVVVLLGAGTALAQSTYYPPPGDWERRTPEEVGMDAARLTDAIAYAESRETSKPMDFSDQETLFGQRLGPIPDRRAHTNGLVVRHGYIVAEFGDTTKVDPTYSAAKSYLSTLVGVAVDQGLIHDVHDPVRDYVDDGGYASPQNAPVTWHHHLQQTTEWEGELWDRTHDFVGAKAFGNGEREPRALQAPGTYYEYNDVRINRLALSLMRVFGRPLPEVLKDEVMDPIGASDTWRYLGYENSWVDVHGQLLQSVTGRPNLSDSVFRSWFDELERLVPTEQ